MGRRDEFSKGVEDFEKSLWGEFFAPPTKETIIECAERVRFLSSKDSAEPGPYRSRRTPYCIEPTNCLNPDSPTKEVVLKWGAQTAKTTVLLNWVAYVMQNNPTPMMIVQPTIDMAKRFSRQRLQSMITDSPFLSKKASENRSRDEANTILLKEFNGGYLVIAGANSASGLRSMPICYLAMDEVDAYPQDADGEGDPAELAIKRQTTFSNAKRIVTSTPTVKGFSKVDARFLATDQCFYHVPCPHCGTMQPLEMGYTSEWGLKWKKHKDGSPILKTVAYICRQCGSEIDESHKTQMLDNGMWVPKHPENGIETRGFQLSSLYSPLGWLSWRAIVDEYHKARMAEKMGDNTLMKVFVNTREGEVFEESGDKTDSNELKNRAGTWDLRVVLKGHYVITVGVDVQGDRLHMVAWAWGRKMSRQLVDRKVFYGDPAREEGMADSPWTKLTEWLNTPIYNELGKQISVLAGFIDSGGHHTQQVYRYCKAHQNRHIYPCKGQSIKNKPIIGKPSEPEVHWSGRKMRCGLKLWPIGTDTAKTEIYGHMRVNIPGDGFMSLTKKAGDDFFDQIASEILVTKLVRGRPVQEWILPPGKRNEDLDCTVYALAAAIYAGVDKWQDGDFLVLKDKLENDIPAQQMQQSQQTQSIKPKKPPKLPRMFQ